MALIDLGQGGGRLDDEPPSVKVLIVDDDDEDVYLLKRWLRRSKRIDYQVFACQGLDEGAAIAAAEDIDVVIVDFFLGVGISIDSGRPGHDLLSWPFILLSGLDVPDLEDIARGAGALGFLCKGGLTVVAVDELVLQAGSARCARTAAMAAPGACGWFPD
jgi:CheY-like chemotaxis protein